MPKIQILKSYFDLKIVNFTSKDSQNPQLRITNVNLIYFCEFEIFLDAS